MKFLLLITLLLIFCSHTLAWEYVPRGSMEIADYYPHYVRLVVHPDIQNTPVIISPQGTCGSEYKDDSLLSWFGLRNNPPVEETLPSEILYTNNESYVDATMIRCIKYKVSVPATNISMKFYPRDYEYYLFWSEQ